MCFLIYFLASLTLLAHGGTCELTWDKVYGMLSAKLDKIIFEQDVMKKEIKDLTTSITATNQQLSEVAAFNQMLASVQERLDTMDSHVKDVATVEVGRHTNMLRRGLEQEKASTQSRFNYVQKIQKDVQSNINVLMNGADDIRVQISDVAQELKSTAELLSRTEDVMNTQLNETRVKISNLEQEMMDTFLTPTFVRRIEILEKTQSDMKGAADKTRAQISTVEQKVAATQSNTQSIQSRVQSLEGTQGDLRSKTNTLESQVDTTRGQISRLQQNKGTFAGFSARLSTKKEYYDKNIVIIFDDIIYNRGSHYSPSTGIFTAPVSGVYVFMFNVEVHSDVNDKDTDAHVSLLVNGQLKAEANVRGLGHGLTGGNAAVVDVTAGHRVYVCTANLRQRYYIWPYRSSFSGALLHVN